MEAEVKPKRGKRRADGSMRPAAVRYRRKRDRARRTAWLKEFEPGVRGAFFGAVDMERAVFAGPFARESGLSKGEAEAVLANVARTKGWLTLVTRSGRTVGIGPAKVGRPAEAGLTVSPPRS